MFDKKDEAMHRGLVKLIDEQGTFELKTREMAAFSHVIAWVRELPSSMKEREEAPRKELKAEAPKPRKKRAPKEASEK